MGSQKGQYIHICGKSGMNFAVWLYLRLKERGMETVFADCTTNGTLNTYASCLNSMKGAVVPVRKWALGTMPAECVLFYHEQEDLYTDLEKGIYLLFTEQQSLSYTKILLEKLTGGALCLFEPVLIPQLQKGSRVHLLALYNGHAAGEYYIPAGLLDELSGPFEEQFLQILSKSVLSHLSY